MIFSTDPPEENVASLYDSGRRRVCRFILLFRHNFLARSGGILLRFFYRRENLLLILESNKRPCGNCKKTIISIDTDFLDYREFIISSASENAQLILSGTIVTINCISKGQILRYMQGRTTKINISHTKLARIKTKPRTAKSDQKRQNFASFFFSVPLYDTSFQNSGP